MADDPTEAVGIIGALSEAGLLRATAVGTSELGGVSSETIRLIGALRDAGLLGPAAPMSLSDPQAGPQVGDIVNVGSILQVSKHFYTEEGGGTSVGFLSKLSEVGRWGNYYCAFPPNDDKYLTEIDKILAAPKPLLIGAKMEITQVIGRDSISDYYSGRLRSLRAIHRTPQPPPLLWTG